MDFVTDGCMMHDLAYSCATRHQSLDHGVEKDLFSWQNLFSEMLDLHGFVLLRVYQEYPSFSLFAHRSLRRLSPSNFPGASLRSPSIRSPEYVYRRYAKVRHTRIRKNYANMTLTLIVAQDALSPL